MFVKRKYQKTLESLFSRPVSANIKWRDIESLLAALGAEVTERDGSRIEVFLFGEIEFSIAPILVRIQTRGQLQAFENGSRIMRLNHD